MAARRLSADLRPPSPPLPPPISLFPSFDNRSHGEKKRGRLEGWDASRVELHFVVIVVLVVLLVVARFFPSLFFSVIFLSSTERNIYIYINISSSKLERFLWKTLNTIEGLLLYYIYIYIFVYVNILLYYYYGFREKCEKNL